MMDVAASALPSLTGHYSTAPTAAFASVIEAAFQELLFAQSPIQPSAGTSRRPCALHETCRWTP